jgi:aspartate 1-decarboxylase
VHRGDRIIIVAYAHVDPTELGEYEPTKVFVDENNAIVRPG